MAKSLSEKGALTPLILVVALFFFWGVANNLNDILIPQFRKAFALNDLFSGLVQSAFYLGYFLFALPAGFVMRRFGYKAGVLTGLILFGVGALGFYPAAAAMRYEGFLISLFVIASGLAFLETSANPLITVLGDPSKSVQRLNLVQAFNPLGSITAVMVGQRFILSGHEPSAAELAKMSPVDLQAFHIAEAHAVQAPYLILGAIVLVWAVAVAVTPFPHAAVAHSDEEEQAAKKAEGAIFGLFKHPRFLFGVLAQFAYVGAQVGVWSYTIRYAEFAVPGIGEKAAGLWLRNALILFMIGRFVGTWLLGRIAGARLMAVYAVVAIILSVIAALQGGMVGLIALTAISFFMSIMFPSIFAISVRDLGPLTKTGSSFLVMSIVGGAAFTAIMGRVSDLSQINLALLVPAACFAIILAFALALGKDMAAGKTVQTHAH